MAGRALPYNTMKAEAQDRDGRKAMGEEKERNYYCPLNFRVQQKN